MAAPTPRDAVARGRDIDLRLTLLERRMSRPGGGSIATTRITDWNLASATGNYVGVSAANAPTPTGTYVGVTYDSTPESGLQASATQVVYSLSSPFRVWRRFYNFTAGTGWTAWEQHEAGAGGGSVAWADITGKPSSFPSTWADVSGKPSTFPPSTHTHTWAQVTGKPTTFAPSAHSHDWDEVTGKPSTFPSTWATVSGKPSTFPPSSHTHPSSQITDFSSAVDARVNALVPTATTSVAGKVELATNAESVDTLPSDATRAVTPAGLHAALADQIAVHHGNAVSALARGFTTVDSIQQTGFYYFGGSLLSGLPSDVVSTSNLMNLQVINNAAQYEHGSEALGTLQKLWEVDDVAGVVVRSWIRYGRYGTWGSWKRDEPIQLATTAETRAGTNYTKAVTPAGLRAAYLDWAMISAKNADDSYSVYPMGNSVMFNNNTVTGWPSTYGTVQTIKAYASGGGTLQFWTGYNTDEGRLLMRQWMYTASAWGAWTEVTTPQASSTIAGKVELATNAETQAGTDSTRAVTPAGLSSRTATTSRAGIAEIATNSEINIGTDGSRIVTPAGLASLTATVSWRGLIELATNSEVQAGTDALRAVTPAGLRADSTTTATANRLIRRDSAGRAKVASPVASDDIATKLYVDAATGGVLPPRLSAGGEQITNWNSADAVGYYYSSGSASNRPPGTGAVAGRSYSTESDMIGNPLVIFQEARVEHDPLTLWTRWRNQGGVWSAWSPIHSGDSSMDLTSYLVSGFSGSVQVRAVGKQVELTGVVAGTIPAGGTTTEVLSAMPAEYRPTSFGNTRFGDAWRSGYAGNVVVRTTGTVGLAQNTVNWSGASFTAMYFRD